MMPIVDSQNQKVRTAMVQCGKRRLIHVAYRDLNGNVCMVCGRDYDHDDCQVVRGFTTDRICKTCVRRASQEHIVGQDFKQPELAITGD